MRRIFSENKNKNAYKCSFLNGNMHNEISGAMGDLQGSGVSFSAEGLSVLVSGTLPEILIPPDFKAIKMSYEIKTTSTQETYLPAFYTPNALAFCWMFDSSSSRFMSYDARGVLFSGSVPQKDVWLKLILEWTGGYDSGSYKLSLGDILIERSNTRFAGAAPYVFRLGHTGNTALKGCIRNMEISFN